MAIKPIVILEDDEAIAELIDYNVKADGYDTRLHHDGDDLARALPRLAETGVSLFILDVMVPGMSGFDVCRAIRALAAFELTPVLMLTARASEADKVRGLDLGADDYLTKPFGVRELRSRIHSLTRRYDKIHQARLDHENDAPVDQPLTVGSITLDDARHRVFVNGEEVDFTHREYELLHFLMKHRGIAYSRDDLLNYVWGFDYAGETRTVDVHIRQIRKKLSVSDDDGLIETVRGRGYRMADEE